MQVTEIGSRRIHDGELFELATPTNQLGAYRLIERIGIGGMGEVWRAEHALLGRPVAIKVLLPELASRTDVVTRFFNEARAAAAIADRGIVQIFDVGCANGTAYIVMELLAGETLEQRCRHLGGVAVHDALRIVRQVASSLGAAHAAGIVHRDLKPENIFLVRDDEVAGGERAKLLDFGIAKLSHDPGIRTMTAALMGTPAFMSPEQCRGAGDVDPRSDIYSLGCVLFMILANRPPFQTVGMGEMLIEHICTPAPRVSSVVATPPAVDELIARCLDKDPARRFANGYELAAAIDAVLAPTVLPLAASTLVLPAVPARRSRGIVVLASLALAAAAITSAIASPVTVLLGL